MMPRATPQKLIIDTDPGIDDALAIVAALAAPELEVLGLTTVFGNASLKTVTRNALRLLELIDESIPVFPGATGPIARPAGRFPVQVHGRDGMGDTGLPEPGGYASETSAAEYLVETLNACPRQISVLALGPLTNLARALQRDPDLPQKVDKIVIMGGAFFVPGNVSPVAEANIRSDPHAADLVFSARWDITAIGLDVTSKVIMDERMLDRIGKSKTVAGPWIRKMCQIYLDFARSIGTDGIKVHDPTALVCLMRPDLFETVKGPVCVVTEGLAEGQTICAQGWHADTLELWKTRPRHTIAVDVQSEGVLSLLDHLLGKSG